MYVVEYTIEADSGYGRQLQDALDHLHSLALSMGAEKLRDLLPRSLAHTLEADFEWQHTAIQLELDKIIETRHNASYDLTRVTHQQASQSGHACHRCLAFHDHSPTGSAFNVQQPPDLHGTAIVRKALCRNSAQICRQAMVDPAWSD